MFGAAAALAAPKPADAAPPMRFLRVIGDDARCRPHCPEWIAAEGRIEIGTARAFARVITDLGDRRLPILINSPGGSVPDAITMGRLIRSRRLAVAVAHTNITPCASPGECGEASGASVALGAFCASACPLVLAGGVERYVSPAGLVGLHQITTIMTRLSVVRTYRVHYRVVGGQKEEISRELIGETRNRTTTKEAAGPKVASEIASYLENMGVGGPTLALIAGTPSTSLHLLTMDELEATRLATIWIDSPAAMQNDGANGLTGMAVDAKADHTAELRAHGETAFFADDGVRLESLFDYRRGGGLVRAEFSSRSADASAGPTGLELKWSPGDGGKPLLKSTFGDRLGVDIPLDAFCELAVSGRLDVARLDRLGSSGEIDIHALTGMKALIEEACPAPAAKRAKA